MTEHDELYPPEGDKRLTIGKIRNMYDRAVLDIQEDLRNYWLNHAYLKDHQWLYWSEYGGRLEDVPRDPERVQGTVNRLRPATRSLMSKLMQRPLVFEVMPFGADDARIRGARLAESVLRSMAYHHQWERLRENLAYAVWKGGTAAVCVEWDPDQEATVEGQKIHGDTHEEALNITQFVLEPGTRNPEEARWWIKAVTLPPEDVQARFGLAEPPPADAGGGVTASKQSWDAGGGSPADENLTLVLTYYERPSRLSPEGRVVVIVNDKAIHDAPWPFPFEDRLNLVVVRESPDDTRWTGDTALTSARQIQTLVNLAWSSLAEHGKDAGNARLLLPATSSQLLDDFTDAPGGILVYPDGTDKPEYLAPPQLPGWIIDMPDRLGELVDDIVGVHDISRGKAPRNIESGFGLSILVEQDSTPISRLTSEFAMAFSRLGTMVLQIYEAEVRERRVSAVRETGRTPNMILWTGKDLYGQTTANVPLEQILPRSRAAQLKFAQDLLQAGLVTTLDEFLAVAEVPGSRETLDLVSPDVARARRENAGFLLGRQSVVEDFDDDAAHLKHHNDGRKTVAYEMAAEEIKQIWDEHIAAHEVKIASKVGRSRLKESMDPALAMAPSAQAGMSAPELEAMIPQGPQAPAQPQQAQPQPFPVPMSEPVDEADQIIQALRQIG